MACRPTYNRFIEIDENLSAFDINSSSLTNCSGGAIFFEKIDVLSLVSDFLPLKFHLFFHYAVRILQKHLMHEFCLIFYINPGHVTQSHFSSKFYLICLLFEAVST
jgi:hypothetical protein